MPQTAHLSDVSNQRKFRFITTLVGMARYIRYLPVLRRRTTRLLLVAISGLLITVLLGSSAGSFLVVNDPKPSDVIVVLAGDHDEQRYQRALGLLAGGFGKLMIVDARADNAEFGQTSASRAERFVQTTAGGLANRV